MTNRRPARAAAAVLVAVLVAACSPTVVRPPDSGTSPSPEPTVSQSPDPTASPTAQPPDEPTDRPTAEPTAEPSAEPTTEPTAAPTPEPTAEPTDRPTAGPTTKPDDAPVADPDPIDRAAAMAMLADAGYHDPALDGPVGWPDQAGAALMAFQKANGLAVDGILGPQTWGALTGDPVDPASLLVGGPDTRIEVDLDRQLVLAVDDGRLARILHASSGNGQPYTSSTGHPATATTPIGTFTITRRVVGTRHAPLGLMYDPLYFHRGFALHGSDRVPAREASHGCVRLTRPDARWLAATFADGTPVIVHGGRHIHRP